MTDSIKTITYIVELGYVSGSKLWERRERGDIDAWRQSFKRCLF